MRRACATATRPPLAVAHARNPSVCTVALTVKPNSRFDGVCVTAANQVEVRTTAAPVEGAANTDVIKQLSKLFGVPKSSVEVVRGEKAREKVVAVGLEASAACAVLEGVREE